MAINRFTIPISYTPPLDWEFLLHYLHRRLIVGVEYVAGGAYHRAVEIDGTVGTVIVHNEPTLSHLVVSVEPHLRDYAILIKERVSHVFDVVSNWELVRETLIDDPVLGPLCLNYPGIRIPGGWSPFEILIRTIVGQQTSVRVASMIMARIMAQYGRRHPYLTRGKGIPDGLSRLFPLPQDLATADLSDVGLTQRRQLAINEVAKLLASEDMTLSLEDDAAANIKKALRDVPGIGPWTVEYFALRAWRDVDAWPGTDLVLRRAVENHPSSRFFAPKAVTDQWRPFRGYAAVYLWHAASQNS